MKELTESKFVVKTEYSNLKNDEISDKLQNCIENFIKTITNVWKSCGLNSDTFLLRLKLKTEPEVGLLFPRASNNPNEFQVKFYRIRGIIYTRNNENVYKFNLLLMDNRDIELDTYFTDFGDSKAWKKHELNLRSIKLEIIDDFPQQVLNRENNNDNSYILKVDQSNLQVLYENSTFKVYLKNCMEKNRINGDYFYMVQADYKLSNDMALSITLRAISSILINEKNLNFDVKSKIIQILLKEETNINI